MSFKEIADALNAMPETEAQKARFAFHIGKGKEQPMDDIDRCITITCKALRTALPAEIAAEVERLWRESVAVLREENDQLRAALKRVEWVGMGFDVGTLCPVCRATEDQGHASDCALAAALKTDRAPVPKP